MSVNVKATSVFSLALSHSLAKAQCLNTKQSKPPILPACRCATKSYIVEVFFFYEQGDDTCSV